MYPGSDSLQDQVHQGFNTEADECTALHVPCKHTAKEPPMELMITALLHKTDDSDWTQQDLSPLKDIQLLDATRRAVQSSAWTPLADGTKHLVDFKDVDGYKSR